MTAARATRTMRTTLPCGVALWLAAGSAAASCDPAAAGPVVERYLAAVQSPTDCRREMARLLDVAEDDVRECPDASAVPSRVEFETEFLRRTSARFVRVREVAGGWVADIAYRGPDPLEVQMVALSRSPFCPQAGAADADADADAEAEANAGESLGLWTAYQPEGLRCDPVDWDAIPVVEEQGVLPMACRAGRWVPTPPPEPDITPARHP